MTQPAVLHDAFTTATAIAGLFAEKLLTAVNSTNTGAADYAGITAATLIAARAVLAWLYTSRVRAKKRSRT